jgi:hypothetical protein
VEVEERLEGVGTSAVLVDEGDHARRELCLGRGARQRTEDDEDGGEGGRAHGGPTDDARRRDGFRAYYARGM